GGGGGGGAYSKVTNLSLTAGNKVAYVIGAGGAATVAGGDSYFCNALTNCASISGTAVVAAAKGGSAGATAPSQTQTFTTSGAFTVPAYSSMTVAVNGGGGGGGGGGTGAWYYTGSTGGNGTTGGTATLSV